ncbi:MAG TPA: ATP-binding protein [Gemmatimonadaceae bacterium]|nr:ATP-binding protein [Gemmatimonadaceae bacterium]
MSGTVGERDVTRSCALLDRELAGLLADLAESPDFAAAESLLLKQFSEAAGSTCVALYVVDPTFHRLELRGSQGVVTKSVKRSPVPLDDEGHPMTVAAIGQEVVVCGDGELAGLPFESAVLVPLPQARFRGGPQARPGRPLTLAPRFAASAVFDWPGASSERRRRLGHVVFGVLVLEGRPHDGIVQELADAALYAGPVIARAHALEGLGRTAERLDDERNLLTAIISALPDPIVITDSANRVVVQNQRADLLLSMRDDDSEGRRRAVEINNLLFSSFLSRAALAGGVRNSSRELNLVDPNEGTDLLFEVLAHPLPSSIARGGTYVSVLRDVTDLKRASIELERQYNRLRVTEMEATRERDRLNLILNNVGDPILVTDDQAKIFLMNPQAEQLFEAPRSHTDRRHLQRVRENDTKFTTLISDFVLSPTTFRRERIALQQPREGRELPVEVLSGKVLNERGEPLAIVSVLHDLTRQVENEHLNKELKALNSSLEDRIRMATADLEAQNLKLQWQSSELERAYRLKSEFLANMSHELRTPINALIGYTALMLDRIYGDLTTKQVEGLTRIQASAQHLLALINDILDLARIEAGKTPVRLEASELRPLLVEVAEQMEPLVKRKALEFRVSIEERIPVVLTDPTKVKQIVLNLLSNAVKFTNRGFVSFGASTNGSELVVRVSDSGIGIKPQNLDVIFEEFRQVDQSRTREYGGTGLGLSITRKLVSLLGGDLSVDSEYGHGTTFVVTLPLDGTGAGAQTAQPVGATQPAS